MKKHNQNSNDHREAVDEINNEVGSVSPEQAAAVDDPDMPVMSETP